MWSPRPDLAPRWYALVAWLVMGAPYVEQTTGADGRPRIRFHDADGGVWTVWDTTFGDYRHHRLAHGDHRATSRVFVAPDGTVRSATLGPMSDRTLATEILALQLRGAGYVSRERFTHPVTDPR